jgi:hypothetical protein
MSTTGKRKKKKKKKTVDDHNGHGSYKAYAAVITAVDGNLLIDMI